jgi:transposase-like protein
MDTPSAIVHAGDCCLNAECSLYGETGAGNIIKFGKTKQGQQRYRCNDCLQTFSARKGTLFYRKRTPEDTILKSLTMVARGARLSSVSHTHNLKPETVGGWALEAGTHAGHLEEALLEGYQASRSEVDGLWSYVQHKGEKKRT